MPGGLVSLGRSPELTGCGEGLGGMGGATVLYFTYLDLQDNPVSWVDRGTFYS